MAAGSTDPFHHVRDSDYFELPRILGGQWHLPEVFGLQFSRFMVLQLVAGLAILWIFRGLSRRVQAGEVTRGGWWNFWEFTALYIRDTVVRPTIGSGHHGHGDDHHHSHSTVPGDAATGRGTVAAAHPADKYLPFVWSCFFYVLFCNLLGAFPWLGSATGEINVTGALALVVFGFVIVSGSREQGAAGFWKALAPSMDVPGPMKIVLVPAIWIIELFGLFIKHAVLAIRLFANMMAGHTVIGVILGFIGLAAGSLFYLVMPASVVGQVAIGFLELLVAVIQAYIFAFLSTLFISMALHPH